MACSGGPAGQVSAISRSAPAGARTRGAASAPVMHDLLAVSHEGKLTCCRAAVMRTHRSGRVDGFEATLPRVILICILISFTQHAIMIGPKSRNQSLQNKTFLYNVIMRV